MIKRTKRGKGKAASEAGKARVASGAPKTVGSWGKEPAEPDPLVKQAIEEAMKLAEQVKRDWPEPINQFENMPTKFLDAGIDCLVYRDTIINL
jgi:hypothetical protein